MTNPRDKRLKGLTVIFIVSHPMQETI